MKKIPTMFERDFSTENAIVSDKVTPGCEWVAAGEGWPTRKLDGTSCMIRAGKLYKRRELRIGAATPEGFEQVDVDEGTKKRFGWVPVGDGAEDQWHREAFEAMPSAQRINDTYELVGPKVQGGREGYDTHRLIAHGSAELRLDDVPRTFDGLRDYFGAHGHDMEGVVWHHSDGRMAKIKGRDFGIGSR